jgi:hypothetical protein
MGRVGSGKQAPRMSLSALFGGNILNTGKTKN